MNACRRFGIPAFFVLLFAAGAFAAGSGSKSQTPEAATDPAIQLYEQGLKKVEAKDWKGALDLFERAHQAKKKDPDILNMLAFTQRKTGQLDDAFTNYAKALEMRPEFPQAREYLAEAHLQAAMEQMKILRDYGSEAQAEVTMLLDAFAKAAWTVGARPAAGDSTRGY